MSTNINGKIGLMFTIPFERIVSLFKRKKDKREEYNYKCNADNTHACTCPGDGCCTGPVKDRGKFEGNDSQR